MDNDLQTTFLNLMTRLHGTRYDFSKAVFVDRTRNKMDVRCIKHDYWFKYSQYQLEKSEGCLECRYEEKMRKVEESRLDRQQAFIDQAKIVHDGFYDYSKVDYQRANDEVTIVCPTHGDFEQRPGQHLRAEGCAKCGIESRAAKNRVSGEEILARIKAVHGDKYDCSEMKYTNMHTDVTVVCREHGPFTLNAYNFIALGLGCVGCGERKLTKHSADTIIQRFKETHGERYDYSQVEYVDIHTNITIVCREHGPFVQMPIKHIDGNGCSKCSGMYSRTNEEWIAHAKSIHGSQYDYSQVEYTTAHESVIITCNEHGQTFSQGAKNHIAGISGCTECERLKKIETFQTNYGVDHPHHRHISPESFALLKDIDWLVDQNHNKQKTLIQIAYELGVVGGTVALQFANAGIETINWNTSLGEIQIQELLESHNVEYQANTRQILESGKELDVYIPDMNLAIEYCGVYYHSERTGRSSDYHIGKYDESASKGIKLITVFEDDWLENKNAVVNQIIKHFNVTSLDCAQVVDLEDVDAHEFMNDHYPKFTLGDVHLGLMTGSELIACVSFRVTEETATLSAFASMSMNERILSMLVKEIAKYNIKKITATVDKLWSNGSEYTDCGFRLISEIEPQFTYVHNATRIAQDNATEKQKEELYKIWDCGHLVYELDVEAYPK